MLPELEATNSLTKLGRMILSGCLAVTQPKRQAVITTITS